MRVLESSTNSMKIMVIFGKFNLEMGLASADLWSIIDVLEVVLPSNVDPKVRK